MKRAGSVKVCFNHKCKKPIQESRNGWRCRNGDFAQLCCSCGSVFVEGRFCETFHPNVPGWRCCETCGKQIHCGCIVSFHMFVLLDGGGIECISCTRKSSILQPNPSWPQPSLSVSSHPEGIRDCSAVNWSSIAGSGPVPWLQAPNLFNDSSIMSELQDKASSEIDVPLNNYPRPAEKQSACSFESESKENSVKQILSGTRTGWSCGPEKGSSVSETQNVNNNAATTRRSPPTPTSFGQEGSSHNGLRTSANLKVCDGMVKGDGRGRSQLLTQLSTLTKEQPQNTSELNRVVSPLFEKTLSASDVGKVGRLVLPKKCAEVYLPPISHPEGLPLEALDVEGNKWEFQFRFWSNNNSRMYVLEGITPFIQALQLRAGDIVTFGRLEPDGKLVMGCRKAPIPSSSDQGYKAKTVGGRSANGEIRTKGEVDNISSGPAICGSGVIPVERVEANSVNYVKRKGSTLASKSKRFRIDNGDLVELKLTCSQAQGLLRPPLDAVPKIIIIEGLEFEEYEAAPVIGRPTIHSTDDLGEEILWVQCDNCFKWRKMPVTLLPSRWTCSANLSDPMRSLCSAPQESMSGHLEDLLSTVSNASTEITRHPQHKSGCTCIFCMQSLNGRVCENEKPNKQQPENDVETAAAKAEGASNVDLCSEAGSCSHKLDVRTGKGLCDHSHGNGICALPIGAGIDLNSQPKRDEEFGSSSNSVRAINLLASRPGHCEAITAIDKAELDGRLSSC